MKALILGASLLLALPAAAAAQVPATPTLPTPPPPPRPEALGLNIGYLPIDQMRSETEQARRDGAGSPSQRRERAQRLAALVNSGQCQAAHDVAVQEGDRAMAERISDVCRRTKAVPSAS